MKFYGVGNTNEPDDLQFQNHLRSEAGLEPLARPPMPQMVRDYWDAIYAGLEAALEAEMREQFMRGEL